MILRLHSNLARVHPGLVLRPVGDRQEDAAPLEGENGFKLAGPEADLLSDVGPRDHQAQGDLVTSNGQVRTHGAQPTELDADRYMAGFLPALGAAPSTRRVVADELDGRVVVGAIGNGEPEGRRIAEFPPRNIPRVLELPRGEVPADHLAQAATRGAGLCNQRRSDLLRRPQRAAQEGVEVRRSLSGPPRP